MVRTNFTHPMTSNIYIPRLTKHFSHKPPFFTVQTPKRPRQRPIRKLPPGHHRGRAPDHRRGHRAAISALHRFIDLARRQLAEHAPRKAAPETVAPRPRKGSAYKSMHQHAIRCDFLAQVEQFRPVQVFRATYPAVHARLRRAQHARFEALCKGAPHGFRGNTLRQPVQPGVHRGLQDQVLYTPLADARRQGVVGNQGA